MSIIQLSSIANCQKADRKSLILRGTRRGGQDNVRALMAAAVVVLFKDETSKGIDDRHPQKRIQSGNSKEDLTVILLFS